ncbi:hypothetical protein [Suid alphaherpesvirus 1]|nr:hypothetical protein [Suid alphaherpesvirus 1]QQL12229.1 hypothetical protein [Suid alphaherpesvirus 1]UDP03515.1 hypothetical protein [Suid alphaherpesvirus 1]UDP03529.1 hypothetical protein [Suid alphaherpesvirus 1]
MEAAILAVVSGAEVVLWMGVPGGRKKKRWRVLVVVMGRSGWGSSSWWVLVVVGLSRWGSWWVLVGLSRWGSSSWRVLVVVVVGLSR